MNGKKLQNLRAANYMQLRKLEASPEMDYEGTSSAGNSTPSPEDLLRLVSTILECYAKGLMGPEAALHAVRELVRE